MLLFLVVLACSLLASSLSILDEYPIGDIVSNRSATQDEGRTSVAIIGAGLAGASVASRADEMFYLNSDFQLTIYERKSEFGGRIRTIRPHTEFDAALELGATTFYTDDGCLMQLLNAVGVHHMPSGDPQYLPIKRRWTKFQSQNQVACDVRGQSWLQFVKRLWRLTWRFRNEVISALDKWHRFPPIHKLIDTVQEAMSYLGLLPLISGNAPDYLDHINISRKFQEEIVRPCVRARFGQDLEEVHVVLAGPLQLLDIDLSGLGLDLNAASTANDFIEAHITHFTSPFQLVNDFSNPSINISITNDDLLTSSSPPGDMNIFKVQGSDVCYFYGCPPAAGCNLCELEYLYRIHSQYALGDAELAHMLGLEYNENVPLTAISWVRRDVWPKAFLPYRKGQDFVGKFELAPRLYYTGGGEEVMSSMEMSCKTGERVASRLVFGGIDL
ncbi:hypothetical protein KC345_g2595 [Hortaea werneckii]|nr:hypothetical protein KC345_g2595 [Hortaea werneckii]